MINDISDDAFATLLFCAEFEAEPIVRPFTTGQWSRVVLALVEQGMTPKDLFNVSSVANLHADEREKVLLLLATEGRVRAQLKSLASMNVGVVTRGESDYPSKLKKRLKAQAPPVLFYAGNLSMANMDCVGIVGMRNAPSSDIEFTNRLAQKCAANFLCVVSGGARGVDLAAETSVLQNNGYAIVYPSNNMLRKVRASIRHISNGSLLVLSASRPSVEFRGYLAMERNKYIYASSNYTVAVSSHYNKGGTWGGAINNLKSAWCPLFVQKTSGNDNGNEKLLAMEGVSPISYDILDNDDLDLRDWFECNT